MELIVCELRSEKNEIFKITVTEKLKESCRVILESQDNEKIKANLKNGCEVRFTNSKGNRVAIHGEAFNGMEDAEKFCFEEESKRKYYRNINLKAKCSDDIERYKYEIDFLGEMIVDLQRKKRYASEGIEEQEKRRDEISKMNYRIEGEFPKETVNVKKNGYWR